MEKVWTIEELQAWIDAPDQYRVGRSIQTPEGHRNPPSHRELLSMIIQLMRNQQDLEPFQLPSTFNQVDDGTPLMASPTDRHCPNCNFLLPKATRPRAKQEGSVETPPDLFNALSKIFSYVWDLAAEDHNSKCEYYFSKEEDSLKQDWRQVTGSGLWGWLNPEFGFMKPWAAKCAEEMQKGAQITMLAQASVGSRWYRDHVQGYAQVWNLYPRVQFVGHPIVFPKDLILCVYEYGIDPCVRAFNWKEGRFTYG